MHFLVPIRLGDTVILKAAVNYVHRTSMEIGVRVEREALTGERREHAATAYLTYVALDPDGKPHAVPDVIPTTDEEHRRHQNAVTRREFRLARRKALISKRT